LFIAYVVVVVVVVAESYSCTMVRTPLEPPKRRSLLDLLGELASERTEKQFQSSRVSGDAKSFRESGDTKRLQVVCGRFTRVPQF
jgi:hypothetical protein